MTDGSKCIHKPLRSTNISPDTGHSRSLLLSTVTSLHFYFFFLRDVLFSATQTTRLTRRKKNPAYWCPNYIFMQLFFAPYVGTVEVSAEMTGLPFSIVNIRGLVQLNYNRRYFPTYP